jgi:hypothetical protein
MSSIENVSPEELVKLFHHYQEALASDFDSESARSSPQSWDQTPANERKLKIAAARLALLELASTAAHDRRNHEYYAKPGEAEWGC